MNYIIDYKRNEEIKECIIPVIELTHKIIPNESFEPNNFTSESNCFHHLIIWNKDFPNRFVKKIDAICSYLEYDVSLTHLSAQGAKKDDICVYIMLICLDKNLQGKGIAKELLKEVYKRTNNKEVYVKIEKTNQQSIRFFEKNGYERRTKKSVPNVISKSYRKPYFIYSFLPYFEE